MASGRMIALLGLLAVAGYQNRDKLGDLLGRVTGQGQPAGTDPATGVTAERPTGGGIGGFLDGLIGGDRDPNATSGGGFLDKIQDMFGGGQPREAVNGGVRDLVEELDAHGQGAKANSWVSVGANSDMDANELEQALGEDTIDQLTKQTGLSRNELLVRLQSVLPAAVDTLTPDGRLPAITQAV